MITLAERTYFDVAMPSKLRVMEEFLPISSLSKLIIYFLKVDDENGGDLPSPLLLPKLMIANNTIIHALKEKTKRRPGKWQYNQ